MHVQVVNFQVSDIDPETFIAFTNDIAPAFADVPGLIAKIFLYDPATATYGGVYTWETREAYETYSKSALFYSLLANPRGVNMTSRDFGVIEPATRITRGLPPGLAAAA